MTLVQICRSLMNGGEVEGYSLKGNVFSDGKTFWQVRPLINTISMIEIPNPDTIPYGKSKKGVLHKSICRVCGGEIVCKVHKTICVECAREERKKTGTAIAKVCISCGETFYIDYYDHRKLNMCRPCRYKKYINKAKLDWKWRNIDKVRECDRISHRKRYEINRKAKETN